MSGGVIPELGENAPALETARREIQDGTCSCVVVRNGAVVFRGEGRGVAPIKRLYESEEGRRMLEGALLADKVLGKAAAMLLVLGKVAGAFGETVSEAALAYLEQHGIPCGYGRLVPRIQNREGTGLCPIEQAVMATDDPQEGYEEMARVIRRLMEQK